MVMKIIPASHNDAEELNEIILVNCPACDKLSIRNSCYY